MSWFPESIVDYPVSGSELGLIVRPIGGGIGGALKVETTGSSVITGSVIVSNFPAVQTITGSIKLSEAPTVIQGTSPWDTTVTQNVKVSRLNNTSTNLKSSEFFSGSAEDTLGVAGLQVVAASDMDLKITVQQGDGIHWDVNDEFLVSAGVGDSHTVQAVGEYFKILVQNVGSITSTYCRVTSILCPIVEALPRTVGQKSSSESLAVVLSSDQTDLNVIPRNTDKSLEMHEMFEVMVMELGRIRVLLELLTDEKVGEEDIEL